MKPFFKNPEKFSGVYTRDQIKNVQLEDGEYVLINQDSSEDGIGGTHWVGLKRDGETLLYFDSFNMPPLQTIVDWVNDQNHPETELMVNTGDPFQHVSSTMCGYYVTHFFNTVDTVEEFEKFNDEWSARTPAQNEKELEKIFDF